ncbi:hypothetical protein A3D60_00400 [Candidatus Uhrbacteria bacterium RIFCSPHIGHO2_02_FULL_47_29]|nr:MAG: hypothetical protein UX68_C0036G0009 [Parcubacteria group bacterium GW2011_GWA2_46_9]OGL60850.1 MAG: hypothetical protein A2752_00365 [Candidatus Uhrbacteria bacterium RIFCSPHIGHO2_01_FULL_46_23]OGL68236.1 MAG: hypothetical protein A3D60_00400 [Candidatus Uhrbacteria bacterium RIFCSPHIGHO2_02_FULL_47_29]OGL86033.1 MAG: hypothetical protein A3I37_01435 [Candidatus Uhrbacteria bacterium RIFCSPLOWO2_02_FULL_46_19]
MATTTTPITTTTTTPVQFGWRTDVIYPALALIAAVIVFSLTMVMTMNWNAKTTFGVAGGITTIVFTRHVLRRRGFSSRFITLGMYTAVIMTLWPLARPYVGVKPQAAMEERSEATRLKFYDEFSAPALGMQAALDTHKRERLNQLTDEYNRALAAIRSNQSLTLKQKRTREQKVTVRYYHEVDAVSGLTVSDPKVERVKRLVRETAEVTRDTLKQWVAKSWSALSASTPSAILPDRSAALPSSLPLLTPPVQSAPLRQDGKEIWVLAAGEERCYHSPTNFQHDHPIWVKAEGREPIYVTSAKGRVYLPGFGGRHCYQAVLDRTWLEVWPKNG